MGLKKRRINAPRRSYGLVPVPNEETGAIEDVPVNVLHHPITPGTTDKWQEDIAASIREKLKLDAPLPEEGEEPERWEARTEALIERAILSVIGIGGFTKEMQCRHLAEIIIDPDIETDDGDKQEASFEYLMTLPDTVRLAYKRIVEEEARPPQTPSTT